MDELLLFYSHVAAIGRDILDITPIRSGTFVDTDLLARSDVSGAQPVPCAIIIYHDRGGHLLDVRFYFDPTTIFRLKS